MLGIGTDELHEMLTQLRRAIASHEQWFSDLGRTVICRLPLDPRDLAEDPHRQCDFGHWYYGHANQQLHQHPDLVDIELAHRRMHELGRRFLFTLSPEGAGSPDHYDAFCEAVNSLHETMHALKHEIEDSLYRRDALTGAENRVGMLGALRDSRELVRRNVQVSTVAILDLDHFKAVNDTYGHLAGDRVLVALVQNMQQHLRPYDRVFRYGGEEFLIFLPATDLPTAHGIAERMRLDIEQLAIDTGSPEKIQITASFGISNLAGDCAVEESVRRADSALFAAKHAGRNRTCLWDPAMPDAPGGESNAYIPSLQPPAPVRRSHPAGRT